MTMLHGRAFIKVDGDMLRTAAGPKLKLGGVKRTPVVGDDGLVRFIETTEAAELEADVFLTAGMSLQALRNMKGATITYEADTGQVYVVRNAFTTDVLQVAAGNEGKVALKMAGDPAQEMGV